MKNTKNTKTITKRYMIYTARFRAILYIAIVSLISITALLFIQDICLGQISEYTPQLFLEANQAYENGDFSTAAMLYEQVIESGTYSGMLYYNLGNCYTKLGEIGEALFNYRKAQRLIPRDEDLRFNLNYVLDQRKDKIELKNKVDLARVFFFWYYLFNLKEFYYMFLFANLLFWLVSLILIYKQNYALKWIRIISFCLFLIFGASFGIKLYANKAIHYGVVTSAEATVRSGNGNNHSPLFILHEGAEFKISEQNKGWMKINLQDGKIGWIPSAAAKIIK